MIGSTVSHYKILDKLGEGGMGVVYKAQDTKLDRLVALKFLPHHLTGSSEAVKRFQQEAKAASALNHPNILTIYDFEEAEDESFIAMELVEGSSLKARITEAKSRGVLLPLDEVLAWTIEIAEGLSKAHEKGIVHRDIKSDNIMVTHDGHPKIMDFGLAKLRGSSMLTKTGTTVGTLAYMAPEQLQGSEADQRADIYAFGVVVFEMTTGQLPFQGAHEAALMYEILNVDPRPPSSLRADIPSALEHILLNCLQKKKENRYPSMKDILADIKTVTESSKLAGGHIPSRRIWPFPPLKKRGIALVAGIILTLIIIAGLFILNPGNQAIDSVAVMPFKNVSANDDVEYLSDGITENLINSLSRISSLRVVPRSTAFSYKDRAIEAQQIGKELNVRAVVTGRVVQRGDNLNVQTELIDIDRQAQIWGEQYSQKMSDILGLQEQLARQISEKLRLHLTGEEKIQLTKRYTENTEAYQLYLKGNYYVRKATPEDLEKGLSLFHQALALDPNFALPYVGIAYYYMIQTDFSMAPTLAMPEAKKATARALSIDVELADARAFDGMYDLWYTWNWSDAEKGAREAIRLDPNDYFPHFFYSWCLLSQGDSVKALEEAKRYLELEPLSAEENAMYAHGLYYAHRYDEAFNHLQKTLDLTKDYPFTYLILSWCYLRSNRFPEAIATAQKMYEIFPVPWCRGRLAYVYARAGERSKAFALLDTLRRESKQVYVASDIVASVYTALGDKDRAFEYLDKGFQERAGWMTFMKVDPIWDPLRSDHRFSALMKRMNLEK